MLIGLFKRETEHLCRRHEHIFRGNPDTHTERERELFIQEGNRAPVAKATHARNWEGPVPPRVRR